jgi:predicted nucleic acid-binding protein
MYLIDTNVISELRKGQTRNPNVDSWYSTVSMEELFLSVLVLGEIRSGAERLRRRDPVQATALERWLDRVRHGFRGRIFDVDQDIADLWGRLNMPSRLSVVDSLLAATALRHGLTLVTRNIKHITRTGVTYLNPFEPRH